MATKTYYVSDLSMPGLRYRSLSGTEIFAIRVYKGVCLFNINLDKVPKPIFNRHIKLNEVWEVAEFMSRLVKMEPKSDITLVHNAYDRVQKQKALDYVLILRKDEKKIFHIIVKTNGQMYDFPIKGASDFSYGTGEIPEEERSYMEWTYIINYLKVVARHQVDMSSFPPELPAGGQPGAQGGQGGAPAGGYQRQAGQGNYNRGNYPPRPNSNGEFQSTRGLPSDDDMFE